MVDKFSNLRSSPIPEEVTGTIEEILRQQKVKEEHIKILGDIEKRYE